VSGGEGFLSRWSRRKAGRVDEELAGAKGAVEGAASSADPARASALTSPRAATSPPAATATPAVAAAVAGSAPAAEPPPAPMPTLEDVAALTRSSDFSRFVAPGVEPGVRNAAMKKLFSDPHFNVMDGLDTYIDDYGKADPIPPSMLRLMNQAATLGLFDHEVDEARGGDAALESAAPALACPDGTTAPALAQSTLPPTAPGPAPATLTDDDADLRLQPDDAARCSGPGPGPRA
jgi:hypothetical protein